MTLEGSNIYSKSGKIDDPTPEGSNKKISRDKYFQ